MQDGTTAISQKPNPLLAIWHKPLLQAFLSDGVTLTSGIFLIVVLVAVLFAPPMLFRLLSCMSPRLLERLSFVKRLVVARTNLVTWAWRLLRPRSVTARP